MAVEAVPLLILGGTGRIGTILHDCWPWAMRDGLRPIWQARRATPGFLEWNILHAPPPPWAGGIVLHLAGGRADPAAEVPLARAVLAAAAAQRARHVFLASSAAVYAPGADLDEAAAVEPPSAYGRIKRAMERAALDWHALHADTGLTILRIGNVAGADALLGGAGLAQLAANGGHGALAAGTASHVPAPDPPPDRPVTADRPGSALRRVPCTATPPAPITLDPVAGAPLGPLRSYIGPVTLSAVLARLARLAAAGAPLPVVLNVAAPRPVAMGALLDAAGLPWAFGAPDPAVLPCVTLDTSRLQALVRLPPNASQPRAMVAEWRNLSFP